MDKLVFIFVALSVAAVYAAPDNFLASLKSLNHFKRAEALLKPLHALSQHKREMNEMELAMLVVDLDHDNMLDVDELKMLMSLAGTPADQLDQLVAVMMNFDADKNGKLDMKELENLSKLGM